MSDEEIIRKMNFGNFDFENLLNFFWFKLQKSAFINKILTKITLEFYKPVIND